MYSCKVRLPIDLYFSTQAAGMNATTSTMFMQQLWERLQLAYKTAQVIDKESWRHEWNCCHKVRWTWLQVGDLVLLKQKKNSLHRKI